MFGDIIVASVILVIVVLIIASMVHKKRSGMSIGCDCGGCSSCKDEIKEH
ncbi:MAG: FeoB-associated Cys-rich membrane protein [Spirochaetia bacterium]|jgi:hypothetical protein|nr:FeoB-associated Cys-rich membrane protein [Spirochaetia bacterium]